MEATSKLDVIANLEKTLTDENTKRNTLIYSLQKIDQKLKSAGNPPVNESINNNDEILVLRKTMNDAYTEYLKTGSSDQALLNKYNQLKATYQEKVSGYLNKTQAATPTGGEDRAKLIESRTDLETDIQAATSNIESIKANIAALKGNMERTASKGAYVETLMKELELTNKEYLAAKQKYNDAIDINSASINNFRQILRGQPAIEPEPSKRKLIVGMAGVGALMITLLIITLLTILDSSIKTPAIFARSVGLKLIGMINITDLKKKTIVDIISAKSYSDNAENRINVFRESVRKLRYEIEKSGKHIFLFTSTRKGQGKTTIIQALSYSMSLNKKKILIIDTNFCNNDLTVQMNAQPVFEKIAIEAGNESDQTLLERIRSASKNTGYDTVYVLGSEGGDYTPSEVLAGHNLLSHLPELSKEYDYIFLEGPPLNDFSDSRELSQYVDGVIAVFSAESELKQIDKESLTFLNELNGKYYGSILNKVDLENVNNS